MARGWAVVGRDMGRRKPLPVLGWWGAPAHLPAG